MRKSAKPNAKDITAEKLAELKENALGILSECRRNILYRQPFTGSVMMQLNIIPTRDQRCPTAATDGKNIYFDIAFLSELKPEERSFVLAHELWHVCMLHTVRKEGRDHKMFNLATDMEVNQLLMKEGFTCPATAVLPALYGFMPDLSAEEYYELLLKQQKLQSNIFNNNNSRSSTSSSGSGNQSSSDKSNSSASDNSDENVGNGSGNDDGKLDSQFDKHIYEGEKIEDETTDKNVEDKYGKVTFDKDFMPNPTKADVEKVREAVISAAQQIERSRGSLPAHLKGIVGDLLEPTISWKEILCKFVTRSIGDGERTWNKPNKRMLHSGMYLPSSETAKIKVGVILDTSGSTEGDIPRFLTELNGLIKTFGTYELKLIQCDAEVQQVDEYDENNQLDLEHTHFKVAGMGGTYLTPAFNYMNDNFEDIDCIVVLTDGGTEVLEQHLSSKPTLFLICKGGETTNCKFGEIIKLTEN